MMLRAVRAWLLPPLYYDRLRRRRGGRWVPLIGPGWRAVLECAHVVSHHGDVPRLPWIEPWEKRDLSLPHAKRCCACERSEPLFGS